MPSGERGVRLMETKDVLQLMLGTGMFVIALVALVVSIVVLATK